MKQQKIISVIYSIMLLTMISSALKATSHSIFIPRSITTDSVLELAQNNYDF